MNSFDTATERVDVTPAVMLWTYAAIGLNPGQRWATQSIDRRPKAPPRPGGGRLLIVYKILRKHRGRE